MALGRVNAENFLQLFGHSALFLIERNIDEDVVVYQVQLNETRDEIKGITCTWAKASNASETTPVSDLAKTVFYGVRYQRLKRGVYRMQIACSQQFIDLHIKKPDKVTGVVRVVPKVLINGKECTLTKIYTDITTFPPSLKGLWVQGRFKDELLQEEIRVDPDVVNKINFDDFLPKLAL